MLTNSELERLSAGAAHGTHARYNAHLLAGDEPCDPCRNAEAEYRAELKARRGDRVHEQPRAHLIVRSRAAGPVEPEDDEFEEEEEEEDELDLDDAPPDSRAANMAQTWETIGKMGGLFGFFKPPTSHQSASAPTSKSKRSTTADPGTRLRAITAELDARKPRGSHAVELLVEAAPYLAGRVTALAQYGEARGCAREDIVAAERIVLAQSGTWGR